MKTYPIMDKIHLYELPAQASSSEYHKLINAILQRGTDYPPYLSKPYVTRALQRLGFVPVGKDKSGCLILFNPHHNPAMI